MLKDGRKNIHHKEQSGRQSAVGDDLVETERWHFTISELSHEFSLISRTVLYETITVGARLSQVFHKMGSENAHGCTHSTDNDFGFDFLERYHKDDDEFLNHIV
jgi:hypothetical protein